ncbi:hypothetical protein O6H91_19G034100 [Diphasiastrum complanatum]|uniref:Uncharacterized protein n=1 Tax=Diphasiastrum complanatum TaxID=34168 RepID=A0ACC2AUB4_DIPCM|nr:hypothetical protein O6H91_19G034100 [Diphasiastrum complanatum]
MHARDREYLLLKAARSIDEDVIMHSATSFKDRELRYRFLYHYFPTLTEEDIIGKRDDEIHSGPGVEDVVAFKREVLCRGYPAKREITFCSELLGQMTYVIAAEPVFSKDREVVGLNYVAVDITKQAIENEKLIRLREEVAVQKAMESELHKTIHITEETMRAKQMLATMSHEIRSPLAGVVSIAEVLATTNLDGEQREMVDVMLSSSDLILQLINDIADLSKFESGALKLEAKKFRPREVVKNVLQMAVASMQGKNLVLEGYVAEEVPIEVIGDVLRIRQILTNLVSNAIKFTHQGQVSITLRIQGSSNNMQRDTAGHHPILDNANRCDSPRMELTEDIQNSEKTFSIFSELPVEGPEHMNRDLDKVKEANICLFCEVCDTGIGIPENAIPSLFKEYTQASSTTARKYGGTGLGLAICKQLVELMGGNLSVKSKENEGSSFFFTLNCKSHKDILNRDSNKGNKMSDKGPHCKSNSPSKEASWTFTSASHASGILPSDSKFLLATLNIAALDNKVEVENFPTETCAEGQPEEASSKRRTLAAASSTEKCVKSQEHEVMSRRSQLEECMVRPMEDHVVSDQSETKTGDSRTKFSSSSDSRTTNSLEHKTANGLDAMYSQQPERAKLTSCDQEKVAAIYTQNTTLCMHTNKYQKEQNQLNILLAEDNKVNVMVARSMLQQFGLQLDVAYNGAEAVKAVKTKQYDLILMDVQMPIMDGLEATQTIRGLELQRNSSEDDVREQCQSTQSPGKSQGTSTLQYPSRTPIVAMTADTFPENVAEFMAHGMDSFVPKPVTFKKLSQVLREFFPWLKEVKS